MSDYLWDKTGGPDAEVERLEALLGVFGHTPRALELSAEAAPCVRPPSRLFGLPGRLRASGLFAPAGLAAAAALLLVSFLGTAALLRSRVATEENGVAASETRQQQKGVRQETTSHVSHVSEVSEPARAGGVGDEEDAARLVRGSDGRVKDERAAVEDFRRGPRGRREGQLASLAGRRQMLKQSPRVAPRAGAAPEFEAVSAGVGAPTLFESTRLMAKEQLVYALRLTGLKLRDVRLRTQGRDGSEPPAGVRAPTR
jgi:hypothetical protein